MWQHPANTQWLGAALAVVIGAAGAEEAAPPPPPEAAAAVREAPPPAEPVAITKLKARGYTVEGTGVIGRELEFWLLRGPDKRESTLITSPKGFVIQGKIFDPDNGHLMLDTATQPPLPLDLDTRLRKGFRPFMDSASGRAAPASGSPPTGAAPAAPASVWDYLGQATVIEEGPPGAPLVYIFIDPFCAYCHKQWEMARAKLQQGAVRIRWVPVAVLDTSQRRLDVVMGLLHQPSAAALTGWMRGRKVEPRESEDARLALARNTALFEALKVPQVPAMIYKDKNGQLVRKAGVAPL